MEPWIALSSWGIPVVVGTVIAVIVHRNRKPGSTGTALTGTARVYSLEPFATSVREPSVAALAAAYNRFKQTYGNDSGQWASVAELLASGRRVHGTLVSFAATGNTLRALGRTAAAKPELLDAPQYIIAVEFRLRESGRVIGRNVQSIPVDQVPRLAVGLQLPCAVDTSDLAHRFVVDWDRITFR